MTLLTTEDAWSWVEVDDEPWFRLALRERYPLPNTTTTLYIVDYFPLSNTFTIRWTQAFVGPSTGAGATWGTWDLNKRRIIGWDYADNFGGSGVPRLFEVDTSDPDWTNWTFNYLFDAPSGLRYDLDFGSLYFTGPSGRYIYYNPRVDNLVSDPRVMIIHDTQNAYSYNIIAFGDMFGNTLIEGDITDIRFSPNGRYIVMNMSSTYVGSFMRVYDRVDLSVVYQLTSAILPSFMGFSRDSQYFWHNQSPTAPDARDIRVLDTNSWSVVAESALTYSPVSGGLPPNMPITTLSSNNGYWAGHGSAFGPDNSRVDVYNFDFSIYDLGAMGGSFGSDGPLDWTPDSAYLFRADDNINFGGIGRYRVADMTNLSVSNFSGIGEVRTRAFSIADNW